MADIAFTAYCTWDSTPPATGRVQWRVRKDLAGPSPAKSLAITGTGTSRTVSWVKSASPDYSYAVVRLTPGSGAGATPTSGWAVYSGTGGSAPLPAMTKGAKYTALVYLVDKTGNVSKASTIAVTG